MKRLKIHKFRFKTNCLGHRVQNAPQNSAKTSLPWLHFKTDHALRREENKVAFLEGRFLDERLPFLPKKYLSILLNFLFPFFVF